MSLEWQVNSTIVLNSLKDCLHPPIMQSCLKTITALKSISELLFPPISVLCSWIITGSVKRRRKRGQLEHSQRAQLSLYFFSCHFAFALCGSRAFTQSFGTEDHCDWGKTFFSGHFSLGQSTQSFYHPPKKKHVPVGNFMGNEAALPLC